MNFINSLMLWGGLAAAVPIALHLFFRSRYRLVPWAAMKFLLTSIEQTSRRLKFQELLLLMMRCLVLILLAFALARPLMASAKDFTLLMLLVLVPMAALIGGMIFKPVLGSRWADVAALQGMGLVVLLLFWLIVPSQSAAGGGGGAGVKVDATFVFDTSYSMGATDGSVTRFERAKAEALRIIEKLPSYSTVQIVTCADRAEFLGPRAPADLEHARKLIQGLQLTSLATDLYPGVVEAASILQREKSSNEELYIFSDMQKLGWEQQAGGLARVLQEAKDKDKATIFLVRCGAANRKPANVAIVGITPQSGAPRPGERVGFAVLVRNTSSESVKDVKLSLTVDGNDKLAETQLLPKIDPGETRAVTLSAKLEKAGLRLLTARVSHDDLEGDNRFDQVVLVREQINILVVDGGVNERDQEKSSSFYLMHALLPVKDTDRHKYHLQPRLVSARLASPALLAKQDLCILVNVALKPDLKKRVEVLPGDFIDELERFVRQGHGLMIFGGDNALADPYNQVFGKKHGLLPLPIKGFMERLPKEPLHLDRNSVGLSAFWKFKEDDYYKGINDIQVWKTLELEPKAAGTTTLYVGNLAADMDEAAVRELFQPFGRAHEPVLAKDDQGAARGFGWVELAGDADKAIQVLNGADSKGRSLIVVEAVGEYAVPDAEAEKLKHDDPVTVALRYGNGLPAVVGKRVDAGEVLLFATAADLGHKPDSPNPVWSDWPLHLEFTPFLDVTISHLLHGQTQTYNIVAGEKLDWMPTSNQTLAYTLIFPDGKNVRLGLPEKKNNRFVVTAQNLPVAGIYRMASTLPPQAQDAEPLVIEPALDKTTGTPLAVVPDLRESQDLDSLSNEQLDRVLGFRPIHVTAGVAATQQSAADRLNREWTTWLLVIVLFLTLAEAALAWWCGRAW